MAATSGFEPNWVSPPGATVLEILRERGVGVREFADAAHRDVHQVSRLLYGLERLTPEWAENLSSSLGATPGFWLRREELYRKDLARLCGSSESSRDWIREIPLKDLQRLGWVEPSTDTDELASNVCAFFGVTSGETFSRRYSKVFTATAYLTSTAFESRPGAVAAWLRQGEILAAELDCAPWNAELLRQSLGEISRLTRDSDPTSFLPKLEAILTRCGVAMVVAQAPDGCRASGATRFLSPTKALALFSFRYLADDQFWFAVFHELAHLLLHTKDDLFLEGVEGGNAAAEEEANQFARKVLMSAVGVEALESVPLTKFAIVRLARRANVSPGIVVGQLQSLGRLPYKHFNYLKARYTWGDLPIPEVQPPNKT